MEEKYTLLRNHIEEIVPLTEEEWSFVVPFFSYKKLKKHQFLVQKEEAVPAAFLIINGLTKAYAIDGNGKEHILQFAMENYWTTDFNAYQNQCPASLFIDCIEDSHFFALRLDDRETLCAQMPKMNHFFRIKTHHGYIALQQRILSLLTETAEERYHNLLKKLPHLVQRVPKKMLAAYLGVTRETLSRLKG